MIRSRAAYTSSIVDTSPVIGFRGIMLCHSQKPCAIAQDEICVTMKLMNADRSDVSSMGTINVKVNLDVIKASQNFVVVEKLSTPGM